jgi:hypothetical protein
MDHAHGAHAVEMLGPGLGRGLALGHQGQDAVAAHDVVDEPDRPGLSHGER